MMRILIVTTLLAACGTDPKTIDVAIPGTQTLVTEKVNGAWKKLTGAFDGTANATTYSIEIGDEFEVVAVCLRTGLTDTGEFVSGEVFGTSDDAELTLGSWISPNCLIGGNGLPEPSGTPIRVTGTFDEEMQLAVDAMYAMYALPNEPFAQTIRSGLHDIVAYSNTKIVIHRNVELDADTELQPVHVASDGAQVLSASPPVVSPDPDETVALSNYILTRNSTFFRWMTTTADSALFVPAELLQPGDTMNFSVGFASLAGNRGIKCDDPSQLQDPAAMPRLEPFTRHGSFGASWTPLDAFFTTATVVTMAASGPKQSVTASRQWLERHDKGTLDFDYDVDGYDPAWASSGRLSLQIDRYNVHSRLYTASYEPQ